MNDPSAFIRAQTLIDSSPLVPEIRLHLATEITPIWQATENHLETHGIEPPFWAFAWPGSQLLARHLLDAPDTAKGRRILDFACGGGLAAIAAAMAGATHVEANDIDPMASAATMLNASLNGVQLTATTGDLVGTTPEADLLLCGDVCYNQAMANHIVPWLRRCARDMEVWLADPERPYAPRTGVEILTRRAVQTTRELEDRTERETVLYRVLPG